MRRTECGGGREEEEKEEDRERPFLKGKVVGTRAVSALSGGLLICS